MTKSDREQIGGCQGLGMVGAGMTIKGYLGGDLCGDGIASVVIA